MKVAITGSIASGKSEVSNYLRSKGFYVFDADLTNSMLLDNGNIGYLEAKKTFPEAFEGEILNKKKLASIVFKSPKNKALLESIMHPLILEKMNENIDKYDPFFAEIPLLFESNWDKYFDLSILVTSREEVIINRLINKGYSKEEALNRLNNQMSIDDKKKRANEIIYNNNTLSLLYEEVDKIIVKYAWEGTI